MAGFIVRKISKAAIWCRRLALFAIPYFVAVIFFHRVGTISSNQILGLLGIGFVILIISILLAIYAIVQLWTDGAKGGKAMITGLFLSIAMLIPFLVFAIFAMRFPAINELATNLNTPPQYSSKTISLRKNSGVPSSNNLIDGFDEDEVTAILVAFPKISPRRYPAGPERVYSAVKSIVDDRGWKIIDIRGLPDEDDENSPQKSETQKPPTKKNKKAKSKAATEKKSEVEPEGLLLTTAINISLDATASSLIFSFKNDVVINIISEEENTLVEMRSAARWGVHDFGENARIIEKFMGDLDRNLIGIAGEG